MKTMTTMMAAGSLLLLGTVNAQQTEPRQQQESSEGIPATQHQEEVAREVESERFEQLDRDGDGSISREEAATEAALVDSWNEYDRDGDGKLDAEEFSAYEHAAAGTAEAELAEAGQQGRTEAGMPATRHQEEAVGEDLLGTLDRDGDGMISRQEAQDDSRLIEDWDRLDRNRDGKLDASELERLEQ